MGCQCWEGLGWVRREDSDRYILVLVSDDCRSGVQVFVSLLPITIQCCASPTKLMMCSRSAPITPPVSFLLPVNNAYYVSDCVERLKPTERNSGVHILRLFEEWFFQGGDGPFR